MEYVVEAFFPERKTLPFFYAFVGHLKDFRVTVVAAFLVRSLEAFLKMPVQVFSSAAGRVYYLHHMNEVILFLFGPEKLPFFQLISSFPCSRLQRKVFVAGICNKKIVLGLR